MEKEGSALYLCPGCGAFVSENAANCPNCGMALEGDAPENAEGVMPGAAEAEIELAVLDDEIAAQDDSEPVTLYLCSECGAFTGGDAKTCPNCGTSMVGEEETVPPISPEEPEILDMLVLSEEPKPDDEHIIEDLKKLESADDVETFLDAIEDSDIIAESTPPAELLPERSDESDDALSRLAYEKGDEISDKEEARSETVHTVEEMLVGESARSIVGDNDTIALCKSCGAFVSESAKVCNVCGNDLGGAGRIAAQSGRATPDIDISHLGADSVLRKMLGVSDDADMDPDAGKRFQSDGSLGLCTLCGAFISPDATSCPVCGTHIEDMPEFVPSVDVVGPESEKHGLAICPHCGVFVQEGARECLSCVKPIPEGATVPLPHGVEAPEDPDRAINVLRTFLGIERELELAPARERPHTVLELCPDCGAFVSINAVVCSICGNSLFEGAEDLLDLDRKLGELDAVKCPNCGSGMDTALGECKSCGMSLMREPPAEEPEDITDILDKELDAIVSEAETAAPEPPEVPQADDSLFDLLVPREEPASDEVDIPSEPPGAEIPVPVEETHVPIVEEDIDATYPEEPFEGETAEPETLEFIEPTGAEAAPQVEEIPEQDLAERSVAPPSQPVKLPDVDLGSKHTHKAANWTTCVYVSVATLCFFLFFYMIAPGDYAPGLAVIFGTLLVIGSYLAVTEKAIFFRGDLKHASVFIVGATLAALVLLHRPLGVLTSGEGMAAQPALDRILLSVSILLTSTGLLWVRARIRFVFTWFAGNALLFLSTLVTFTNPTFGTESPVMLVAGLGAGFVFLSLIFLQYERAINTSIETDIVRGDAHYLKRDYAGALTSYDDALAKARMKKVEVLGNPIVQYDVPWYSKGSALIFMGDFEEGIKCLDMALAINPCNEVTWVNKGNAHSKLGQQELAMECYTKAIECNPFYEIAWNNLGNVHARGKDYLTALKHYNRAIKINPGYDDAWINKGYVLAKMGKREQAVKCLNRVGSRAQGRTRAVEKDVHLG